MNLNHARGLAVELIAKHGLTEWRFRFDNALRRFGCCKHSSKTITLSAKLTELNSETRVTNTILHEIAHALVGVGHGHDLIWKRKAVEIGCNGERCYNPQEVNSPDGKYTAVCPNCKHEHKRFRKKIRRSSCGYCSGGKFNPEYELKYTKNW